MSFRGGKKIFLVVKLAVLTRKGKKRKNSTKNNNSHDEQNGVFGPSFLPKFVFEMFSELCQQTFVILYFEAASYI